jgi:hypothetical protein
VKSAFKSVKFSKICFQCWRFTRRSNFLKCVRISSLYCVKSKLTPSIYQNERKCFQFERMRSLPGPNNSILCTKYKSNSWIHFLKLCSIPKIWFNLRHVSIFLEKVRSILENVFNLWNCVQFWRMRSICEIAFNSEECVQFVKLRSILKNAFNSEDCVQFSRMHSILKNVFNSLECVQFSRMRSIREIALNSWENVQFVANSI